MEEVTILVYEAELDDLFLRRDTGGTIEGDVVFKGKLTVEEAVDPKDAVGLEQANEIAESYVRRHDDLEGLDAGLEYQHLTTEERTKLGGIELNAERNLTSSELITQIDSTIGTDWQNGSDSGEVIVSKIDAALGNTDWQTQPLPQTALEIIDLIDAQFGDTDWRTQIPQLTQQEVIDYIDLYVGNTLWQTQISPNEIILAINSELGGIEWQTQIPKPTDAEIVASINSELGDTLWQTQRPEITGGEIEAKLDAEIGVGWKITPINRTDQEVVDSVTSVIGNEDWKTRPSGSEIVDEIDIELGSTGWKSKLTPSEVVASVNGDLGNTDWQTKPTGAETVAAIDTELGGTGWRSDSDSLTGEDISILLDGYFLSDVWRTHPTGSEIVTALDSQLGSDIWRTWRPEITNQEIVEAIDSYLGTDNWQTQPTGFQTVSAINSELGNADWQDPTLTGNDLIAEIDLTLGNTYWKDEPLSGSELVSDIDATLGTTEWKSQKTPSQIVVDINSELGNADWQSGGGSEKTRVGIGGDYANIGEALTAGGRVLLLLSDVTETGEWDANDEEFSIYSEGTQKTIYVSTTLDSLDELSIVRCYNIKFVITGTNYIFRYIKFYMYGRCDIVGDSAANRFSWNVTQPNIIWADDLHIDGGASQGIAVSMAGGEYVNVFGSSRGDCYGLRRGSINSLEISSVIDFNLFEGTINYVFGGGQVSFRGSNGKIQGGTNVDVYIRSNLNTVENTSINELITYTTNDTYVLEKLDNCIVVKIGSFGFKDIRNIINCTFNNTSVLDVEGNIENIINTKFAEGISVSGDNVKIDNCKVGSVLSGGKTITVNATADNTYISNCWTENPIVDNGVDTRIINCNGSDNLLQENLSIYDSGNERIRLDPTGKLIFNVANIIDFNTIHTTYPNIVAGDRYSLVAASYDVLATGVNSIALGCTRDGNQGVTISGSNNIVMGSSHLTVAGSRNFIYGAGTGSGTPAFSFPDSDKMVWGYVSGTNDSHKKDFIYGKYASDDCNFSINSPLSKNSGLLGTRSSGSAIITGSGFLALRPGQVIGVGDFLCIILTVDSDIQITIDRNSPSAAANQPIFIDDEIFKITSFGVKNIFRVDELGEIHNDSTASFNGIKQNISTKVANYTATKNDNTLLLDGSTSAVQITLPDSSTGLNGLIYVLKAKDITNTISVVTSGADTFEDATTTYTFTSVGETIHLQCDETNGEWILINKIVI